MSTTLSSSGINLVYGAGPSRLVAGLLLGTALTVTGGVTPLAGTVRAAPTVLVGQVATAVPLAGVVQGAPRLAGTLGEAAITTALAGQLVGSSRALSTGITLVYPAGPIRVQSLAYAAGLDVPSTVALAGTVVHQSRLMGYGPTTALSLGTGYIRAPARAIGALTSDVALSGTIRSGERLLGALSAPAGGTPIGSGVVRGSGGRLRSTGLSLVYPAGPVRVVMGRMRGSLASVQTVQGGVLRAGGLVRASALGNASAGTTIGTGRIRALGRLRAAGISLVYPAAPIASSGGVLAGQLGVSGTPVSMAGTVLGSGGRLLGIETTVVEFAAEIVGPTPILWGQLSIVATTPALGTGWVRNPVRLRGFLSQTVYPAGTVLAGARLSSPVLGIASGATPLAGRLRAFGPRLRGVLTSTVPLGGWTLDGGRLRGRLLTGLATEPLHGHIGVYPRLRGYLNPGTFVPGTGTGRTHLWLGQADNALVPVAGAGELYILTGAYGNAAGIDTPLLVETPDIAPQGPQGRLRLRRITVPIQLDAACTLRITPIVDYMKSFAPLIVSFGTPSRRERRVIQVKELGVCTVVRLRIEVLDREGLVEVYRPTLYYTPLSSGTMMAMGGAP